MNASDRIKLIRNSNEIFVCGLVSLLPLIGFFAALYALIVGVRLGRRFKGEWNPAANYLGWGIALSCLSFGINALAGLIAILRLIPPFDS